MKTSIIIQARMGSKGSKEKFKKNYKKIYIDRIIILDKMQKN